MKRSQNVRISELNPHLMCVLCGGYYVDATTIIECLHSFCKACIVRYLDSSKFCPICDVQVHKTKPLINIRPDHALQNLVYKLVPGLFTSEVLKRRKFYRSNPSDSGSGSDVGQSTDGATGPGPPTSVVGEDTISVSLELSMNGKAIQRRKGKGKGKNAEKSESLLQKRYLLCPSAFTIGHVKRFIRMKLDLSSTLEVDVFHVDEPLSDSYALLDIIYIYSWSKQHEPFPLFFSVFENSAKRQKCDQVIPEEAEVSAPQPEPAEHTTTTTTPTEEHLPKKSAPEKPKPISHGSTSPSLPAKAVKRKLDDELNAVDDLPAKDTVDVIELPSENNVDVNKDTKDNEQSEEEEDLDRSDDVFDDRPSNGCKISTSSSGKSIVVSIPKHLLETSGSEKEKRKKSKRRDSHHHHKHHRKHRRQSREDKESSKSRKRRESKGDNLSSDSTSPASYRGGSDSAGVVSQTFELSPTAVNDLQSGKEQADVTDTSVTLNGHDCNTSPPSPGKHVTDSASGGAKTTKTDEKVEVSPESPVNARKSVTFTPGLDAKSTSAVVDLPVQNDKGSDKKPSPKPSPKRTAQREPVLSQLQEEWNQHKEKNTEAAYVPDKTTDKAIKCVSEMKDQSMNKKKSSDDPKPKEVSSNGDNKTNSTSRGSPAKTSSSKQSKHKVHKSESSTEKKNEIRKHSTSPQKKVSVKPKDDQTSKSKHQSHSERPLKEKSTKDVSPWCKPLDLEHRAPKDVQKRQKCYDPPQPIQPVQVTSEPTKPKQIEPSVHNGLIQKSKQVNERPQKPILKDNKESTSPQQNSDQKQQQIIQSSPKHKYKAVPYKYDDQNTKNSHAQSSTTQKQIVSVENNKTTTPKTPQDASMKTAGHVVSVRDKNNTDKGPVKISGTKSVHSDKMSSSPVKRSPDAPVISQTMPKAVAHASSPPRMYSKSVDKEGSVRRQSGSPRHTSTAPAPIVHQDRPDTLNVPIPWKSLTSLAEAGRKVQESANTALGRTSPCGSSARQISPSWLDDRITCNGLTAERIDNSLKSSVSPFSDHLSTFESPSLPKGIKTYSKKDKLTYKSPNPFTHSPYAYESAFKNFLGGSGNEISADRKPTTPKSEVGGYTGPSLLVAPKRSKSVTSPISGVQRHIHGHKVIGQLNMVYETIQKPSYSEVHRKVPKQISPNKAPTYIFDKDIDGDHNKVPTTEPISVGKNTLKPDDKNNITSNKESAVKSPQQTVTNFNQCTQDKPTDKLESQAKPQISVISSNTSQEKISENNSVLIPERRPSAEHKTSIDTTQSSRSEPKKQVPMSSGTRCESSFSATHIASSPPRYAHMCGASSPTEAVCLKCSPRPRSTSPHITPSCHRASYPVMSSTTRAMLSPREFPAVDRMHPGHIPCPRSVHNMCATGGHSPQNNNLSAAASYDLATSCDQCQAVSVSTRSEPNIYTKIAPQEVPLNLHKPRSRSDH